MSNEFRDRIARSIRDAVRLRYGPGARDILQRGGEVFLNSSEADTAADAALTVVQPKLDAKDDETKRLREQRDQARAAIRAAGELINDAHWAEKPVDVQRIVEILGEVDQLCPACWRLHGTWCPPFGGPGYGNSSEET